MPGKLHLRKANAPIVLFMFSCSFAKITSYDIILPPPQCFFLVAPLKEYQHKCQQESVRAEHLSVSDNSYKKVLLKVYCLLYNFRTQDIVLLHACIKLPCGKKLTSKAKNGVRIYRRAYGTLILAFSRLKL